MIKQARVEMAGLMSSVESVPGELGWFTSTYSTPSQDCVEVCFSGRKVHIRDSKHPVNTAHELLAVTVDMTAWSMFVSFAVSTSSNKDTSRATATASFALAV